MFYRYLFLAALAASNLGVYAQDASHEAEEKSHAPIQFSVDGLFSFGGSTLPTSDLRSLQGGGHDPQINGFNLQSLELSMLGAVDPYFSAEAHVLFGLDAQSGTSFIELEELFFKTASLPYGFQLKGGAFLTKFGRINPSHMHAWMWQDQPVVLTRIFGPDGARGLGLQLGWLMPLPWYSELIFSAQNSLGESMVSFLGSDETANRRNQPYVNREFNGMTDLAFMIRLENGFDATATTSGIFGLSWMMGPNSSGEDTYTHILGFDTVVKWKPLHAKQGWPFVMLEQEFIFRNFFVDPVFNSGGLNSAFDDTLSTGGALKDWGGFAQILYGFYPRWSAGLRMEWASANEGAVGARAFDPLRDDRLRVSPIAAFHPSEFSRLRLQYNFDRAAHLASGSAHTLWLGLEFMYGAHPAHEF